VASPEPGSGTLTAQNRAIERLTVSLRRCNISLAESFNTGGSVARRRATPAGVCRPRREALADVQSQALPVR